MILRIGGLDHDHLLAAGLLRHHRLLRGGLQVSGLFRLQPKPLDRVKNCTLVRIERVSQLAWSNQSPSTSCRRLAESATTPASRDQIPPLLRRHRVVALQCLVLQQPIASIQNFLGVTEAAKTCISRASGYSATGARSLSSCSGVVADELPGLRESRGSNPARLKLMQTARSTAMNRCTASRVFP